MAGWFLPLKGLQGVWWGEAAPPVVPFFVPSPSSGFLGSGAALWSSHPVGKPCPYPALEQEWTAGAHPAGAMPWGCPHCGLEPPQSQHC